MLPLHFADPADYEKILVDDRISLVGLSEISPETMITAVIHHKDGTEDRIQLRHTLNDEQVEWFKAGSALNVLRARD